MKFLSKKGVQDILQAVANISLPVYLAYSDIRQRYRRSSLGPFWITISTGVMIVCLAFIFGTIYRTSISNFLPFVALGLITWSFLSSCINDATVVFINAEPIIKQLPIPLFAHVLRMVSKNFIIFCHNILLFPLIMLCVGQPPSWLIFLVIPGLAVLLLNLLWVSLIIAIVCSRFRDLGQIVASILQVFFYITPIIWMPTMLSGPTKPMLLGPNPFFHLIEIVRSPLIGQGPSLLSWSYCLIMLILGWCATIKLFNKYRGRIAYWL